MQRLLDVTLPILSHPTIVLDSNMGVMGSVQTDETHPLFAELIQTGYMTTDLYQKMQKLGIFPDSARRVPLHISSYDSENGQTQYSMCYQIRSNHLKAYVLVFCCKSHPSNSYQYLMDMVVENLTLYFRQHQFASSNEGHELFLSQLFQNPNQPLHRLQSMIESIGGLSLNGNFLLAQIYLRHKERASTSFICWNIRQAFPNMRPFVFNDSIYVLLSENDPAGVLGSFVPAEKEALFINCFSGFLDHCVVSQPFRKLQDAPQLAKQCELAYEFSHSNNDESIFIYYRKQAFEYLTSKLLPVIDPIMIRSSFYQALKIYDIENGTHFRDIVYQFIICFRSMNQTAEQCYLHRNTIQNNLKKAFQIMNNSLEDYNDALFFVLNYRLDQ